MSPIKSISPSSTSDAASAYREYLARLQAQKAAAKASELNQPKQGTTPAAADVDHDGDRH